MRAFSVARSSSISTQPAMPGRRRQPGRAPLRRDAEQSRQRNREQIAEHRRQRDAHERVAQRRARVAQRVVGGRVQPAERRREQSDRRSGENAPDVDRVARGRSGRSAAAPPTTTSPSARNAIADGTTKNAIRRRPASSRRRSASIAAGIAAATPDIAGSSAADTDMPNRLTGSV